MPFDASVYDAALDCASAHARRWLDGVPDRPIPPRATADEILATLGGPLPDGPTAPDAVIDLLAEEAGISTPLRLVTDYSYDGADSVEIGRLYETVSDGPFVHPAEEVAEARFVAPDALDQFMATHKLCSAAVDVMVTLLRRTPAG